MTAPANTAEKAKHTPGPWSYDVEINDHGGWEAETQDITIYAGEVAISIYSTECAEYPDDAACEANARLIAAAPDLLEALSNLCALYESDDGCLQLAEYKAARAALARATGATP